MLLDDQLMKVGAMNASPFVKPFKKESYEWEAMLRLLQVRAWALTCKCVPACLSFAQSAAFALLHALGVLRLLLVCAGWPLVCSLLLSI
jgi:hypothetical protein